MNGSDDDRTGVNFPRAAGAGLLAGIAVEIVLVALRRLGIPLNTERVIGMMFAPDTGATYGAGLVVFLAANTLAGLLYAIAMSRKHRYDWWAAMPLAAVHLLVSGLFTVIAPKVHPRVPTQIESPGPFLVHGGPRSVLAFIALHAFFGALFGMLYTWRTSEDRVWA